MARTCSGHRESRKKQTLVLLALIPAFSFTPGSLTNPSLMLTHSLARSFLRSATHLFICPFIIHSSTCSFGPSLAHTFTHSSHRYSSLTL